ncbi:MAG: hypothetical protein H6733_06950 [Alphaproteobacteria bacterium]|nr:hypothetical protein [Alphaproteobacteria bacterium]
MRWAFLLVAAACATDPTTKDADTDSDGVADTDVTAETGETGGLWDVDTDDPVVPAAPFKATDDPIAPTALDGTWRGTFTFVEVALLGRNPRCEGTIVLTVDPTAPRHVVADLACSDWNPNGGGIASRPYRDLFGIAYATLDPANLTPLSLDISVGAPNMSTYSAQGIAVEVDGDTMGFTYEDIERIGPIAFGFKLLDVTLTRDTP